MLQPNNILIIRLTSLGDVLMSIPAVKAIRNTYPNVNISWLVEGSVARLLAFQDFIDEVIVFPRGDIQKGMMGGHAWSSVKTMGRFMKRLREREYDVVVDFHGIAKSVILGRCTRGTRRRIGFGRTIAKEQSFLFYDEKANVTDKRTHKVERNMLLARCLGTNGTVPRVDLSVPDDVDRYITGFFDEEGISAPVFAVNPFSSKGSDFKRWGTENYRNLIRKIRVELEVPVVILWGPGEKEEAELLRDKCGPGVYLSCPTDVSQLFALLGRVAMYIGGDTGVMHLASFAGTPVVAIFGPTDVKINAPYGTDATIVRRDIPCSPCKKKDCAERNCLTDIAVNEVFEAVHAMHTQQHRGN